MTPEQLLAALHQVNVMHQEYVKHPESTLRDPDRFERARLELLKILSQVNESK